MLAWLIRELPAYRRATGEHRQQLKWLMAGGVVAAVGLVVSVAGQNGVLGVVATIAITALPISVGIGVLKFRLYEIDRLISRTLSYAIVTGSLVAVFLGVVVLTTDVLPFSSPVGVAASTLAAAALFNPLRQRVQRFVDRRFNRRTTTPRRSSAGSPPVARGRRSRDGARRASTRLCVARCNPRTSPSGSIPGLPSLIEGSRA